MHLFITNIASDSTDRQMRLMPLIHLIPKVNKPYIPAAACVKLRDSADILISNDKPTEVYFNHWPVTV